MKQWLMVTHRFYLRQPRSSPWHCRTLTTDQGMILRWCWEAALPRTATLLDQSLWSSWGWPVKLLHQEYHSQLLHVSLSTFVFHCCWPQPRLWLSPWCHQIIQITVTKLFHLCKIICVTCVHMVSVEGGKVRTILRTEHTGPVLHTRVETLISAPSSLLALYCDQGCATQPSLLRARPWHKKY